MQYEREDVTLGTYVVGDIHGCYTAWMHLKDKIEQEDKNAKSVDKSVYL